MIRYALAGLLALASLTACNLTPEQAASTAAALCQTAQIMQPFVAKVKSDKVSTFNTAVADYCSPDSPTYTPAAAAALATALQGIMPVVKQNPVALTAFRSTPAYALARSYGWQGL
jgi:hypothetical protein